MLLKLKKSLLILSALVFGAVCYAAPVMVDTYGFENGTKETQTVGGVTISVQYVATANASWITGNADLDKQLSIPNDDYLDRLTKDGLGAYYVHAVPLKQGDNYYFYPIGANMNAFFVSITNNTDGAIKMKDLKVAFITSDGERYNNMDKDTAFEWICDACSKEIKKQKKALFPNWLATMDMYVAQLLFEGKYNKKFKVINDADAEIWPGETFKGFAFFDGGVEYDSKKNTVKYSDTAKISIFNVPVEVNSDDEVLKKQTVTFDVKKIQVDAKSSKYEVTK